MVLFVYNEFIFLKTMSFVYNIQNIYKEIILTIRSVFAI
jgi:hypothetical protein